MNTANKTFDIASLADMFGLPDFDTFEFSGESYGWSYREAISEGKTESEAEEIAIAAETAEQDSVFKQYKDAVFNTAEKLFEAHKLSLVPLKNGYQFTVKPMVTYSWIDAARAIVTTINGVGMFEFNSTKEFLDSGPYTARQAVLSHLHWIKRYPDVYGTNSAKTSYYQSMR